MNPYNSRRRYSENEISQKIFNKIEIDGIDSKKVYTDNCVNTSKINFETFQQMLNNKIPYSMSMYKITTKYLSIPLSELLAIEKDEMQFSFRKDKKSDDSEEFQEFIHIIFNDIIDVLKKEPRLIKKDIYKSDFKNYFLDDKKSFSEKFESVFKIDTCDKHKEIIKKIRDKDNIIIIEFPNELGISGMSTNKVITRENQDPIYARCIYLNTGMNVARCNFTLYHELYHLYFDKKDDNKIKIYFKSDFNQEQEADKFASNILINRKELGKQIVYNGFINKNLEKKDIFEIQNYFSCSFQSIMYIIDQNADGKNLHKINQNFKKYYNEKFFQELKDEYKKIFFDERYDLYDEKGTIDFPDYFKEYVMTQRNNEKFEIYLDLID